MEPEQEPDVPPVLIVSPDERWLRVLEVTVRLWGHRAVSRRSVGDALRVRAGERAPQAIIFDLGSRWSLEELDDVVALLPESTAPAVVILPERLAAERDRVAGAGATVLIRPYRPSELRAALPPSETDLASGAEAPPQAPVAEAAAVPTAVEADQAP